MSRSFTQFFTLLWKSLLFWSIAMGLFGAFRYYGIGDNEGISLSGNFAQTSIVKIVLHHVFSGFAIGFLYASIDFVFEKFGPKNLSLVLDFTIKIIVYLIFTIAIFTLVLEIISRQGQISIDTSMGWWRTNRTFRIIMLYVVLQSFVFSFIKIATERFGRGVFFKILMGTYKKPKEEKRVFMFLDLKSSTAIAEKIGHEKYSQFIQDCFLDLNEVVLHYDAEIYQYVGDEAVLSWPYSKGVSNNNCINLFFGFEQQRQSRKEYYKYKYGVYPEFKAGLHGGTLMVAEVGFVKKELAYHGDVINTSARIQAECTTHNVSLLLSEKVLTDLNIDEYSTAKSLGSVLLKGKQKEVKIYTIIQ